MPLISTSSPTLSERIFSSVNGRVTGIILIKPLLDFAGLAERCALAAIGPTHVAHADKEGGGKAIGRADFYAEQRGFSAEAHGPNAEFVGGAEDIALELGQFLGGIGVVERAQELLFREFVASGAIAADADTEDAGAAALALGLEDRIENDFSAAVQIAIGFEFFVRQRVLRADIFASAPFKNEANANFRRAMLMEMNDGRTGTDIGAVVDAGEGID